MTMHRKRDGLTTYYFNDYGPRLRDGARASLWIAATDEAAVRAVLAPWPLAYTLHIKETVNVDITLPGGAMALLAIALEQWGPPP